MLEPDVCPIKERGNANDDWLGQALWGLPPLRGLNRVKHRSRTRLVRPTVVRAGDFDFEIPKDAVDSCEPHSTMLN